ncbi:major facilitator family transporter [Luteimicrobium album]|uniref:Major facilitator family transporter n=1 Tax=Luteimicrobium album TaxID=1054550 RepID=A0ABQ6I5J4_9MICO|nr:MFS transporter [Luteimicrobium album]GMA25487.1 major facilitator family transporter [Luteimicrobium album]
MSAAANAAEPGDPAQESASAWWLVVPAMFAVAWAGNEFTPLLVLYKQLNGYGTGTVDVLLAAYVLGIVPALLLGGPLSDRYGRRPLFVPAPFLAIAGSLILAGGHEWVGALFAGRVLCGLALGLTMAVGSSWVVELSRRDPGADSGAGARRASLGLTAGFALGAAVAAALAQWGPAPRETPFLVNVALGIVPCVLALRAPETRPAMRSTTRLVDDLRVPASRHRRFVRVVLPAAPWVFGCAASAYAVVPTQTSQLASQWTVAYSGLLCLVGLGCGAAVQIVARPIVARSSGRATAAGLVLVACGMALAAWTVARPHLVIAVVAAVVLGCAYGLLLVAGLTEVQKIAGPDDLAGLTAVYYALTYVGFCVPVVLAVLAVHVSYAAMFVAGVVVAGVCLAVVATGRVRVGP